MIKHLSIFCLFFVFFAACEPAKEAATPSTKAPHIVFVTGDDEYRSEESMPMLAKIIARELGATTSIVYAKDSSGQIQPGYQQHLEGLEALQTADLAVFFLRFRELPDEELAYILAYVDSGKPVVGFRTSTHAFLYRSDSSKFYLNDTWPAQLFGQQWITHHGHFDDGQAPLTAVSVLPQAVEHPILRGVASFEAYSWLYHVAGGQWALQGSPQLLLQGQSLRSQHEQEGRLAEFPLSNPVAWTKDYTSASGATARVFFTTLGHPYDFTIPSMRRLALNGMYWALGLEHTIPLTGVNAAIVGTYQPSNSGM